MGGWITRTHRCTPGWQQNIAQKNGQGRVAFESIALGNPRLQSRGHRMKMVIRMPWKECFAVSHFVMVTSELWQRMNRFTGERGDLLSNSRRRRAFDLRDVYRLLFINEPIRSQTDRWGRKSYSTGSHVSFHRFFTDRSYPTLLNEVFSLTKA